MWPSDFVVEWSLACQEDQTVTGKAKKGILAAILPVNISLDSLLIN
jgi:hypothetical protein